MFRQLIASGYLTVDFERYGSITLTEKSASVLENKQSVQLRKDPAKVRKSSKSKSARTVVQLSSGDDELFEALKAKRREIAISHGVPPYVIFHDTTLKAIAQAKPSTLAEFSRLPGVGEKKLESYGKVFIEVIAQRLG